MSSTTFTFINKEDSCTGLSLSSFIMHFNVHYKVSHINITNVIIHTLCTCLVSHGYRNVPCT